MKVKIDTKEKFTVLTPEDDHIYDNMADELAAACQQHLQTPIKNLILKLNNVQHIDGNIAQKIIDLQQSFYDNSASFLVCEMNKNVMAVFEQNNLLELLNYTPTESEAWDIVQMEEIERELLDYNDFTFDLPDNE
ncbi:MAG: STAS domain-containing protein [Bacteroidota bacterium]|jgi:anti-anti-sigma regulatory factor|uniref:STAS domain-containing protein n=1 Tax=Hydrotalea sp. TaxID=2881279 RepID=UPI002390EB75|nr:STAS domain-containing protein [Hydrotalea sp.]MDE3124158.1 STAS domain-containing protein [Bacteroidota bacterium]